MHGGRAMIAAGVFPALLAAGTAAAAGVPNVPQSAICLRALTALAGGSVPNDSGFTAAECPFGHIPVSFHFDATHRVNRAVRNIRAGDFVHRYAGYGENVIQVGQKLVLVSSAGTVRIERSVTALQPAHRGQRLFVATKEGQVLSVAYRGDKP